jgi:hypothetical protein
MQTLIALPRRIARVFGLWDAGPASATPAADSGWSRGLESARANALPGAIMIAGALGLVLAYYGSAGFRESLEGLLAVRERLGLAFGLLASALGAGVLPRVYLRLTGRAGDRFWTDLAFDCVLWGSVTAAVDMFYHLQAWIWGTETTFPVIAGKVLLDQFGWTPLVGLPLCVLGAQFRDLGYNLTALRASLRDRWYGRVVFPSLVACWATWIPGTALVYSLPLALQIPMVILIQGYFALVLAHFSRRAAA